MKIKITSSKFVLNWYHGRIGETFEVAEVDKRDRDYGVFGGVIDVSFVSFDDCEILNEETLSE